MVGDRKGQGLLGLQGLNLGVASHLPRSNARNQEVLLTPQLKVAALECAAG